MLFEVLKFVLLFLQEEGDDLPHTYLPGPDESGVSVDIESAWTRQQNNANVIVENEEENYDQAFPEIYED